MRPRVVFSGLAGALLALVPLWMIIYYIWPSRIQEEAAMSFWIEIGGYLIATFFVFITGYVSAKWNWADTRLEAMLYGGMSGLMMGCICYVLIVAAGMGLMGNRVILQNIDKTIVNENVGISYLVFSIISTAKWIYIGFWTFLIFVILFAALGGIVSYVKDSHGWGKMPNEKSKWLFRVPIYTLVFSGVLNLVITMAALIPLRDAVSKTFDQVHDLLSASSQPDIIYYLGALTVAMTFVIPLTVTIGFVLSDWESRRSKLGLLYTWMIVCVLILFSLFIFVGFGNFGLIIVLLIPGFGIIYAVWWVSKRLTKKMPIVKYSVADWLAYMVVQGVLGGIQIYIGVVPYALSLVLIAVVNIPHLTLTGTVEQNLNSQVESLFSMLSASGLILMILSGIFGLFMGWLVLFIRKFFFYEDYFDEPAIEANGVI